MRNRKNRWIIAACAASALAGIQQSRAAEIIWSGAGADDNWSNLANWGGATPPGNDILFNDTDVTAQGTINNIVDQDFTIKSLRYTNQEINGFHTTEIAAGRTLTINGTVAGQAEFGPMVLSIGTETAVANTTRVTAKFTGQGALVVNSPTADLVVRQGHANTGNHFATLDLSTLGTFTANVNQVNVGWNSVAVINRPSGRLLLADVNTITAGHTARAFVIAGGSSNPGNECIVELGRINTISANHIQVGSTKGPGRMIFRQGLTDAVLTLRGTANATARMNILGVGDNFESGATTTSMTGTLDLTGGAADFLVNTLYVARTPNNNPTNVGNTNGILTFEKGTINANTVEMAFQTQVAAYNARGTINVNNEALLIVNNDLRMTRFTGTSGLGFADLNINGGTVRVSGNITRQGGTNTIIMNGGMIDMQPGADTTPGNITATTFSLSSGTLRNAATINAVNISLGSTTIQGAPSFVFGPNGDGITIPQFDASGQGTLTLGTAQSLRGDGNVFGNIAANAGSSISMGTATSPATLQFSNDLSLTNSSLTFKLNNSTTEGSGVNDLINVSGALSLSGTSAVTLTPFNGGPVNGTYRLMNYGSLTSGTGTNLVVAGLATQSRRTFSIDSATPNQINLIVGGGDSLTITYTGVPNNQWNTTDSNFRNGILPEKFFQLDSVIFDDTSLNLADVQIPGDVFPGAVTIDAGRNYTFTGAGAISGGATLTKSGTGTATLANAGVNTYTGGTTVNSGVLRIGNGGTTGNLPAGTIINHGTLSFNRSDAVTFASNIVGSGAVQQDGTGALTLSVANDFTGGLVVNNGTARLTAANAGGPTGTTITVNPSGTLVVGANQVANITVAGGRIGAVGGPANLTNAELTAQANTTSTAYIADAQNLGTSSEFIVLGTLKGSGNLTVLNGTGNANPDSGPGFRLRGTGLSDFSGTLTIGKGVKAELQTTVAGPFSPAGTGKIVLVGGSFTANALTGDYSNFILRNNTGSNGGNTTFGNNFEISGTGFATLNMLGTAPTGSKMFLGNLRIGDNQILGVNRNTTPPTFVAVFDTVTLTGGNATFSPDTPGIAYTGSSDLELGVISEAVPNSGIIMDGTSRLTLTGNNTFTGATQLNRGVTRLNGSLAASSGVSVNSGATLEFTAPQTMKALAVNNASARFAPETPTGLLTTNALSFSGTGQLNLRTGGIVVDYAPGNSPLAAIQAAVAAGFAGGAWNGPGIISSDAAAQPTTAVGYGDTANFTPPADFFGTTPDNSSVLIRYTLRGDLNLDGQITFSDLITVAANFGVNDGNQTWTNGDINYDGNVSFIDLLAVAANFGAPLPASIPGASVEFNDALVLAAATVPEPAALTFLALGALAATRRRRR